MNTFTYSTSNLPSKDVLAVSSLLSLFERRLSAKWVMRNHPAGQSIDVLVVDVDRPGGAEAIQAPTDARVKIAIRDNDRIPAQWLVTRPIRAYGNNGVVVLFNSVADLLQDGAAPKSEFAAATPPVPAHAPVPVPAPAAVVVVPDPPPPPPIAAAPPVVEAPKPPERKFVAAEPVAVPELIDMRAALRQPEAGNPAAPASVSEGADVRPTPISPKPEA
jgi:hypothetical protein